MPGDDGDSSYHILVSRQSDPAVQDDPYFSGEVDAGESFTAMGIDGALGDRWKVVLEPVRRRKEMTHQKWHFSVSSQEDAGGAGVTPLP